MRHHNRLVFRSLFRIKVWLRESRELLGYAGDISEGGMRLICEEPIEVNTSLALSLRLRDRAGQLRSVDVDVVCVWGLENEQTGYYEHGLQLGWPSPLYMELVSHMRGES